MPESIPNLILTPLIESIQERTQCAILYDGFKVIVEPYMLGLHRNGTYKLVAWYLEGQSNSDKGPGWRLYSLDKVQACIKLDRPCVGLRTGYNGTDSRMVSILASVPFSGIDHAGEAVWTD